MNRVVKSRRLKHNKEEYSFFVPKSKYSNQGSLRKELYDLIPYAINIYPKYKNPPKNHTKETEIKLIEREFEFTDGEIGVYVILKLHIHHYTKLYFDLSYYFGLLEDKFGLDTGNVKECSKPMVIGGTTKRPHKRLQNDFRKVVVPVVEPQKIGAIKFK
jgi:hypothetical protein